MKYIPLILSVVALQAAEVSKAKQITKVLQNYVLTYDIDAKSIGEASPIDTCILDEDFTQKIQALLCGHKPLHFTLVGFPYKTTNTEKKTLSERLDAAELYSLKYLDQMLSEVAAIYGKQVKLTIFTDGTVFCDIEGYLDQKVFEYEKALKLICKDLKHIEIKTLSDLLPNLTPTQIRSEIGKSNPNLDEFEAQLSSDEVLQNEVRILEKRMAFEFDCASKKHANVTEVTKKLMHRSLQYSAFLKQYRSKDSIRLSVHYQKDCTQKIGIKLSPDSYVTPWHGVLVVNAPDNWEIRHLEDVDLKSYQKASLNHEGLTLSYFKERR